jgi:hypothetical protein
VVEVEAVGDGAGEERVDEAVGEVAAVAAVAAVVDAAGPAPASGLVVDLDLGGEFVG